MADAAIVFGRATGSYALTLSSPGVARIGGLAATATDIAFTVASAGDVNGDGLTDLLVGTAGTGSNAGATYVIPGRSGGFTDIDLSSSAAGVTRITGSAAGDYTGRSVAAAGDFNGDGYGDIVLGGQDFASFGAGGFAGSASVVFGSAGGIGSLSLAAAGGAAFRINGAPGDAIGRVVASAGDINGDGLADIVTAGGLADPLGRTDAGTTTVIFGKTAGFGTLNLADLGSGGFRIRGAAADDQSGTSVASAGDVNGDGYADLIIGAPYADNNGRGSSGSAYVILGHAGGFADIDLANPGNTGFRIDGALANSLTGNSVAGAGDVNGDGFADLLVGAPNFGGGQSPGAAYVILGQATGFTNLDLATPSSQVVILRGTMPFDRLGGAVSAAGDVNGDGFADVLLGAQGFDLGVPPTVDVGAGYALFPQFSGGALYRGSTLADTLRGTPDGDTLLGYGQNDRLFGLGGDDVFNGGAGNDTIDGGSGTDLAYFSGSFSQYVIGVLGNQALIAGPDGVDRVTDVESFRFGTAAPVSLVAIASTAGLFTIAGGLGSGQRLPDLYSGPVTRLQTQLLGSASGDLAIGTLLNDFFNLLGGDDAVQAGAGDDVIDGGTGSNFLTGGAGRDDFFLDGRGLATTWSTITDWQAGEALSIFGWTPGLSRSIWVADDGTVGYRGATLHADLDGNGLIETSVTWTGLTQAALPVPQSLPGLLWFT